MKQKNIQRNKEEAIEKLGLHKQQTLGLQEEHTPRSTVADQNDDEIHELKDEVFHLKLQMKELKSMVEKMQSGGD